MSRAIYVPAGTTDVQALASAATLLGFQVFETASAAATLQIRNGGKMWSATRGGGTDEQQTLTEGGSGLTSFTVTFSGQTTGSLDDQVTAADLQTALEGLSTIGEGNVSVSGNAGGPYTVTFIEALGDQNVAQMTTTPTGGTGTVTVATTVAGEGLTSFTLTYNSQTTSSLTRLATAAQVKAALEALSNVAEGEATVTGADGGPYLIYLGGTQRGLDSTLTATPTGGTGTMTIATVKDPVVSLQKMAANASVTGVLPAVDCPEGIWLVREPGTSSAVLYVM